MGAARSGWPGSLPATFNTRVPEAMATVELALTVMLFTLYVPPTSVRWAPPVNDTFPSDTVDPCGSIVKVPPDPEQVAGAVKPKSEHVAELLMLTLLVGGNGLGSAGV